jgi:hypothetical protein
MSAIANFRLIHVAKLTNLVEAAEIKIQRGFLTKKVIDTFDDVVLHDTQNLIKFKWSGYIFADLLIFLQERKNIDLLEGEYNSVSDKLYEKRQQSVFILTYEHKLKYASQLSPQNFPIHELINFNKDFSESDDPELASVQLEGIAALKESLDSITSSDFAVLLFII